MELIRHEIVTALEIVKPFLVKKCTLPILESVLIEDGRLHYSNLGTNITLPLTTIGFDKPVAVSFTGLFQLLKKSNCDHVDINVETGTFTCETSATLTTYDVMDYPVPPSDITKSVVVARDTLESVLTGTYALNTNENRFNLDNLYFDCNRNQVIATDGHRLTVRKFETPFEKSLLVPGKFILSLQRILKKLHGDIRLAVGEKTVQLTIGEVVFTVGLMEGDYPDYNKIISTNSRPMFVLDKSAVKLLDTFKTREKCEGLNLVNTKDGKIFFSNHDPDNPQTGSYGIALEPFHSILNKLYLIDLLKNVPIDNFIFQGIDGAHPYVIEHELGIDLIMPIRGDKSIECPEMTTTPAIPDVHVITSNKPVKKANTKKQAVITPPPIQAPVVVDNKGDKQAGIRWGKLVAKLLRKHGRRDVAKFGDRFMAISDTRRVMFYLAAAYSVVKSR